MSMSAFNSLGGDPEKYKFCLLAQGLGIVLNDAVKASCASRLEAAPQNRDIVGPQKGREGELASPLLPTPDNFNAGKGFDGNLSVGLTAEFAVVDANQFNYDAGAENNPVFDSHVSVRYMKTVNGPRLKAIGIEVPRFSLLPEHTVSVDPNNSEAFNKNWLRVTGSTSKPPLIASIVADFKKYRLRMGIIPVGGIEPLPGQSDRYLVKPLHQLLTDRYDTGLKFGSKSDLPEAATRWAFSVIRGDRNQFQPDNDKKVSNSYPAYAFEGSLSLLRALGVVSKSAVVLTGGAVAAHAGSNPGEKTNNTSGVLALEFRAPDDWIRVRGGRYQTQSGKTWREGGRGTEDQVPPIVSEGNFIEASLQKKFSQATGVIYAAYNKFSLQGDKIDNFYWLDPKSTSISEKIYGVRLNDLGVKGFHAGLSYAQRKLPDPSVYGIVPTDRTSSVSLEAGYTTTHDLFK